MKKLLSLLLVFAMLLPNLTLFASATETQPESLETMTETTEALETSETAEITAETTLETEPAEETTEAAVETTVAAEPIAEETVPATEAAENTEATQAIVEETITEIEESVVENEAMAAEAVNTASDSMSQEEFQALLDDAVAAGEDAVLSKSVWIRENMSVSLGDHELVVQGVELCVCNGATLTLESDVTVNAGWLTVAPDGSTLDAQPGVTVTVGNGTNFNANGMLTCGGEIVIEPNGALWINEGGEANIIDLTNQDSVHIGMGNGGKMYISGTVNNNGYLAVHGAGEFHVCDGSTLNILNNENGCGYLDNRGFVRFGSSTINLEGLLTTGKDEETGEGEGTLELWGTTINASEKSVLGVGYQGNLAMNDAVITSNGEISVGKDGALWVHSNSTINANGKLINEGYLHVGMDGDGTLMLSGTADVTGYLAVHGAGEFHACDGSTLNILNNESGCGYLDNQGFVRMGISTVNLDGLCTTGKNFDTGEGDGRMELWGATINASETSSLGILMGGNLAMNDAVITSDGEVVVEKDADLWVHNASSMTINGMMKNLCAVHVGMEGKGTLTVNGTVNTNGYLAVHAAGTLNLAKNGTINILNDENGCGYLDNQGKIQLDGTLKVDGLFTSEIAAPAIKVTSRSSDGKPVIKWDAVDNATKYQVYRATSKNGTYKRISTTTKTSLTNTSTTAGKTYYYKVRAIDDYGNKSKYSNISSRTCDLARPVVSTSSVSSTGKIKLTWKAIDGAVKYEVYRATSKSGTYSLVKTTTSTSYTNTSAKAGKTYYYKVKAIHENSAANSTFSTAKYRTCDLPCPVVSVKLTSAGDPKLTWSAVNGAVKYEVYRATSKNGTYKKMITTTKTSYTNSSATAGKTYYYKVKAIHDNTAANSAYSTVKSITAK